MRTPSPLPLFLLPLILAGCAGAPVVVGDSKLERPLEEATGLATSDLQKASEKKELDLWDVYALASDRTETLASAQENVEQAHAQSRQALGAWLPQISLADRKNWQSSGYIVGPGSSSPLDNSLYLSGSETILGGLTQVAAIQGAQANVDQQTENLKNAAAVLLNSVAQAFYNVLSLQDALQTQQASQDLTQKTLDQQKSWQAIGRAQKSDVLSTTAQLAQVTANLTSTRDQLTQAREALANLAGIAPDAVLKSENETFTAPGASLEDCLARVRERHDVRAAEAAVAVADAQLLQATGGHLPTVALQGQYTLSQNGGGSTPDWNVQLNASLPLFEGGQVFAQEDSASSKKRQAQLQLSSVKRNAAQQVRQVYQNLVNSLQEMDAFQKAVDAAQAAYEAVLRDYKLSLTTNIQVLNSLSTLETTKESLLRAKYQVLADQVALGVATGELPKTKVAR
jgi:outer membrane protein